MTQNRKFISTCGLIYNLLDVINENTLPIDMFSDFLAFLLKYLTHKGLLDQYSVTFNMSESHVENITLYERDNLGYDSDTKELYLKNPDQRGTLAARHVLPTDIRAGMHAYANAGAISNPTVMFHITQPLTDKHPTQAKLESDHYVVIVDYTGDLAWDVRLNAVNYGNLSAEAKPKRNDIQNPMPRLYIPNFNKPERDRIILADKDQYLPMGRIGTLIAQLTLAQDAMTELRKTILTMLPNTDPKPDIK